MADKKEALIFVASPGDKKLAEEICNKFIDSFPDDSSIGFKSYVLQMLLLSFEDIYDVDIKSGMAIKDEGG